MDKTIKNISRIKCISVSYSNGQYNILGITSGKRFLLLNDSRFALFACKYAGQWAEQLNVPVDIPDTIEMIASMERDWINKSEKNSTTTNQRMIFKNLKEMI